MVAGWDFLLIGFAVVLLTGVSKSGFAGGLGVIATPTLAAFVAAPVAAAVMLPILIVIDIANVVRYRRHWRVALVVPLVPGTVAGLAIGAASVGFVSADAIRLAVGVFALILSALYFLGLNTAERPASRIGAFAYGAASGFAGFLAHAGGPPIKGYLLRLKLEKSDFLGANSLYFFAMNLAKAPAYLALGQLSAETLTTSLALAPAAPIGVWLGFRLHGRVDQKRFMTIAFGALALVGAKLCWDGASALIG